MRIKIFRNMLVVVVLGILMSSCSVKIQQEKMYEAWSDDSDTVFALRVEADAVELYINTVIEQSAILVPADYFAVIKYIDGRTLVALAKATRMTVGEEILRVRGLKEEDEISRFRIWVAQDSYQESNGDDPELLGDFNGDGQVEGEDFRSFARSYGTAFGFPGYDDSCDMNSATKPFSGVWTNIYCQKGIPDGKIDGNDFRVFANNYGFANPYLGTWTFTGAINYDSSSFGQVNATGNGTATIESLNYNLTGNVTMSFEADYEDESGNPLHSEMTTTINNVSFDFDNLVMTMDATVVDDFTGSGSTYDVRLRGALRTDGNAVYAEVPSGDIYLLNPERKIGTWSGSKE